MSGHPPHNTAELTPDFWLELVETVGEKDLLVELQRHFPADIVKLLEQIPFDFQKHIFQILTDEIVSDVIVDLEEVLQLRLFNELSPERQIAITRSLSSDDAADLIALLDSGSSRAVLAGISSRQRDHVLELMQYDEESAGGIMDKEAITAPAENTIGEIVNLLKLSTWQREDIYHIYLLDTLGKLLGSISLKSLILYDAHVPATDVMIRDMVTIDVKMDREEVAELFRRYDITDAPVVNESNILVGRITHDDILDVLVEEAEEDIARISGQAEIDPGERSLWRNLKSRLPWLLLGLLGGLIAAVVIKSYQDEISRISSIVFFLPLVAAMGGNAGIQTSSIMVRGFATGEISNYGMIARIFRELGVALLTGFVSSLGALTLSWWWQGDVNLALALSLSLYAIIVIAAIIGVIVPFVLKKFGFDPALATGPFITTTNDIIGLMIYLTVATLIL